MSEPTMRDRLVGVFVLSGEAAADAGVLPEAMDSLFARLRAVADGECIAAGPDGCCMVCGRKLAQPFATRHGCNPFDFIIGPIYRVRRLAVRCWRLGRLMLAAARYKARKAK